MEQGEEAEPQVFAAAQILAGLDTEHQTSFFTFFLVSLPTMKLVESSGMTNRQNRNARLR
jgi:hypothetical protein